MWGLIYTFYLRILNNSIFISCNFRKTADVLFIIFMLNHIYFYIHVYWVCIAADNHYHISFLTCFISGATEAVRLIKYNIYVYKIVMSFIWSTQILHYIHYICIYICMCVCIYIYIYIHTQIWNFRKIVGQWTNCSDLHTAILWKYFHNVAVRRFEISYLEGNHEW
jgi:hypothetical protein